MAIVKWNDSFLLGVPEIDRHHQHLVDLLNQTHDQLSSGAAAESIGVVLDKLIGYATYHFITEERLMESSSYPDLAEHREEHERFRRKVIEVQTEFYHGNKNLPLEVLLFLKNWLTNHILKRDGDFGRYLESRD